MQGDERRGAILAELRGSKAPVSAAALAKKHAVSRQIIVGDVALLRAAGHEILSTARGYVLPEAADGGITRRIAVRHSAAETEAELNAIVDEGCTVLDVSVEHPVYGLLTGLLHIKSRYDVRVFLKKSAEAQPLSILTEGIHLHTLLCPDEAAFERVKDALRTLGVLLE